MKPIFFLLIYCLFFVACKEAKTESAKESVTEVKDGEIQFKEAEFSFGNITEGDTVSHAFEFTNIGSAPFEVISVNVSCGCTVASKPMGPINPGESNQIIINFNSAGKVGQNRKSVGVFTNAKNSTETLIFTANVRAVKKK